MIFNFEHSEDRKTLIILSQFAPIDARYQCRKHWEPHILLHLIHSKYVRFHHHFCPYRLGYREIWGTRKNTWKMEILPVKRNKSLVLKEIRIMLLPIFCWRLFGCLRKCLGIFFHVLNLNQHKTYRFPAFQIHIAQTGPIEVIPLGGGSG